MVNGFNFFIALGTAYKGIIENRSVEPCGIVKDSPLNFILS